jgi:catechol 2,3-dioxygenase-like lactoylglutathione lyase family enzyme
MGFREAFTIRDNNGNPALAYLHITRDTFLELAPATAERPVGLSHVGIWPQNLNAAVAALRQRGVEIADPRTGATRTSITNVTDPNGVRLEFLDFLSDSAPMKAIESWKQ